MYSNEPASPRFTELPVAAQTAYAELAERTRASEIARAVDGLPGSFQRLERRGRGYWYYTYRDPGIQRPRLIYVGPDSEPIRALVAQKAASESDDLLSDQARAAIALGCHAMVPKHFRIVKRLSEYGLFRAGGVLVGTHAFHALGNVLGIRWKDPSATLDVDIEYAGRNVSVALPGRLKVDVHGALQSLEAGLLPLAELDGSIGTRYRSSKDDALRVDFLTTYSRSTKPVRVPELSVALEPLRFMDFLLEDTIQACVLGSRGSCTVNLPAAERFAVHKLVVYGERGRSERTKARKDLEQTAALVSHFLETSGARVFNAAWRDLVKRGSGWRRRARSGRAALLALAPDLSETALWRE